MPIHTCCAAHGAGPFDAIWEYIPGERINFSKFRTVQTLVVECYGPDNLNPPTKRTPWCELGNTRCPSPSSCSGGYMDYGPSARLLQSTNEPYTLPTLREFPLLEKVIIANIYDRSGSLPASFGSGGSGGLGHPSVYLKDLTDIPESVTTLELHRTKIIDIGALLSTCPQLTGLRLQNNQYVINTANFPPALRKLDVINEVFVQDILLTPELVLISMIHSQFPAFRIESEEIGRAVPGRHERLLIAGCDSPYDELIMSNNKIKFSKKIAHITDINTRKVYQHFCEVRRRIHNPYEHRDEPIVAALFLSANYPRRMAEFLSPKQQNV